MCEREGLFRVYEREGVNAMIQSKQTKLQKLHMELRHAMHKKQLPIQPALALAGLNLVMSTRSPKSLSSGFVGFPDGTCDSTDAE